MIDLIRIFDTYNIEYDLGNSGWANVKCPHCDDGKRHGGFNISHEVFHCWKCGNHSALYTLKLILGISNSTLREIVDRYQTHGKRISVRAKKASATQVILPGEALSANHKRYLLRRGFDPDFLENKYGLRGTGPADGIWSFRIIIPIFYNGEIVSFQGRAIKQGMPRYMTLNMEHSILSAKQVLYNIDNCKGEKAIIVEGPFDVMRLGDGVIGTLGTEMTSEQKELIASRFSEVVFLFDPELSAQKRAEKQGADLALMKVRVSICDTELDHDPGSLTPEEVIQIKKELGF